MTPAIDILRCIPVALCQRCGRLLPSGAFLPHPDDGSPRCPICPDAAGCDCDDCLDAVAYMLMEDWHKARIPPSRVPMYWTAWEGLYDRVRLDEDIDRVDEAYERIRTRASEASE